MKNSAGKDLITLYDNNSEAFELLTCYTGNDNLEMYIGDMLINLSK